MSSKPTSTYLQETIDLLVEHFGIGRVRLALARVARGDRRLAKSHGDRPAASRRSIVPNVLTLLDELRARDPSKNQLLAQFYERLKRKNVLPESEDVRQFANLIGLKEITGKSRKDMIPKLIRVLAERPFERLRADIEAAENISDQQRKQGFSVITDKLLSETHN